jgi:hypothetical protein
MNWSARGNVLNQYLRNTSIGTTVKKLFSSPPYSNETFCTKALEYKDYFTPIDIQYSESFEGVQLFLDMKSRMSGLTTIPKLSRVKRTAFFS